MAVIKTQVKQAIQKKLENEQGKLRSAIRQRRFQMKGLAEDQERQKRELAILQDLIRSLE